MLSLSFKLTRPGSVIADMEVLFREGDKNGMKKLMDAVRNNSFGDFDVDPDALEIVITGTIYTISSYISIYCMSMSQWRSQPDYLVLLC